MKNENNFELSNIDTTEIEKMDAINDDEMKQVTGGAQSLILNYGPRGSGCEQAH